MTFVVSPQPVPLTPTWESPDGRSVGFQLAALTLGQVVNLDCRKGMIDFTLAIIENGGPSSSSVTLTGSADGTNQSATLCTASHASKQAQPASALTGPYRYLQVVVATLGGGSSPTLNVTVVANAP